MNRRCGLPLKFNATGAATRAGCTQKTPGSRFGDEKWQQLFYKEILEAGWCERKSLDRGGSWRVPASKRPRDDFWEPNVFRPVYEESWRVRPCMHGWHLPPTQQCVSKAYIEVEWFGRACGLRFAYSA